MAFVQLQSTNPDLGFMIRKNPASGMIAKTIRKGVAFGWYTPDRADAPIYNIWFSDGDNDISYPETKDQEFEYLNLSRYSSSLFVLNAINEFFKDAMKKPDERDLESFRHEFTIGMIKITDYTSKLVKFFQEHFTDYDLKILPLNCADYYQLVISSEKTLNNLLNYVHLLAFMVAISNEEELFLENAQVEKIVDCANKIDAPYFVRYLIKRNAIRSKNLFESIKAKLETPHIRLTPSDTWMSRLSYIRSRIAKRSVIDYGCGEGRYVGYISRDITSAHTYYAIDQDEDLIHRLTKRNERKGIENVIPICSSVWKSDFFADQDYTVILTEVLEHMTYDQAVDLVKQITADPRIKQVLITVPNQDFNVHYLLGDTMRHPDHIWEPSAELVHKFVADIGCKDMYIVLSPVGDTVDNVPVSFGIEMKRREILERTA